MLEYQVVSLSLRVMTLLINLDRSPVSNVHIMKVFNGQANLLHDQCGFLFSESILVVIQNLEVLLK